MLLNLTLDCLQNAHLKFENITRLKIRELKYLHLVNTKQSEICGAIGLKHLYCGIINKYCTMHA